MSIQTVSRALALESVVGSSAKTLVVVKSKLNTINMVNGVRFTFFTFPFPKPAERPHIREMWMDEKTIDKSPVLSENNKRDYRQISREKKMPLFERGIPVARAKGLVAFLCRMFRLPAGASAQICFSVILKHWQIFP